MKRWPWLILLAGTLTWAEEHHGGTPVWVRYDATKGMAVLSTGEPLTQPVTPGQFVSGGKSGGLRPRSQWRPPQDIEIKFAPAGTGRVVFSHERHFGALGNKHCATCHDEAKGLGTTNSRPSLAPSPALEPHGEKSRGRFCANCHKDHFTAAQITGAKPPANIAIFTAFGKTGEPACGRCHAPQNHRTDFYRGHGDAAEGGRAARCEPCHRGARAITKQELSQAADFREAQLQLIKDPQSTNAIQKTMPNNFCAYCHAKDGKPWHHGRGD